MKRLLVRSECSIFEKLGDTHLLFLIACVCFSFTAVDTTLPAQDSADWLPVSSEDLSLKDNPDLPGSSAMILLKKDFRDDSKRVRELYYRIKIFSDEGRAHADIEIPYDRRSEEIKDIAARTIQPDGRVVPFRGRIFEKTLIRQRKQGVLAKTFTLPEVGKGSIIEYRYQKKWKKDDWFASTWMVQEPLFVRQAQLMLRAQTGDYASVDIFARQFPAGVLSRFSTRGEDGVRRAILRDLPPFETEVYMPPRQHMAMRYHIVYRPRGLSWNEIADASAEYSEDFIRNPKELRVLAAQLVSAEDAPETKVRKLYHAVQNTIRNLSYEEAYTKKERKREKIRERKKAADVWKNGYGFSGEIAYLFVALCRAAELKADMVLVSQRDTHYFDRDVIDPSQLDGQLVAVDLPDGPRYFDPGTRFAPFGWISWEKQDVLGFRLRKQRLKRSEQIKTPLLGVQQSTHHRRVTVELLPDGDAHVRVISRYTGHDALEKRNDFFDLSQQQRERLIRDRLEQSLAVEQVQDITWEGLDDASDEAQLAFSFQLSGVAVPIGSRLAINPSLFPIRSPFPLWERQHPVELRYSYTYSEDTWIVPPAGFSLEHQPQEYRHKLVIPSANGSQLSEFKVADYETSVSDGDSTIRYQKKIRVRCFRSPKDNYSLVKGFFDRVAATDQVRLLFTP